MRLFQLHNWRSISRTAKGEEPGPVGSINKLWWSEMSKRLHDTAMAVLGPSAPLWRGADDNPGDGAWQRSWLYYQASSIWAGTNEIQRNVVGERTLGLPREPRAASSRTCRRAGREPIRPCGVRIPRHDRDRMISKKFVASRCRCASCTLLVARPRGLRRR